MDPFKDWHSSCQGFVHFVAGQFARRPSARLKFWAHVGRGQLRQLLHRDTIEPASVLVAEEEAPGVSIENHDRVRRMLDQGAKARFTCSKGGRALDYPVFKNLGL